MASNKDAFEVVSKRVQQVIKSATIKALNKATLEVFKQFKKEIKATTSIPESVLKARLLVLKAKQKKPISSINVAIKYNISLKDFSPKRVKVKRNGRTYYSASIKIAGDRVIVEGGFVQTVKSGKDIVFARTGASRYPIKELKTDILAVETEKLQDPYSRMIAEKTDAYLQEMINIELEKYSNK